MTSTAILHLHRPEPRTIGTVIEPALAHQPGVVHIDFEQAADILAVTFEPRQVTLGELVRTVEVCGQRVSGVAQRAGV